MSFGAVGIDKANIEVPTELAETPSRSEAQGGPRKLEDRPCGSHSLPQNTSFWDAKETIVAETTQTFDEKPDLILPPPPAPLGIQM